MNDTTSEPKPATVTAATSSQQAGDIRNRWWWVEHSLWTQRMLTVLETGVKGGKWFRLWDKVCSEANLQRGFWSVWRNRGSAGVDGQTVEQFEQHMKMIARFTEATDQYIPYLLRKAEHIEDYLQK